MNDTSQPVSAAPNPTALAVVTESAIQVQDAKTPSHPLDVLIHTYLSSLRNIGQTVQIVMPHLSKWLSDEMDKHHKKLQKFVPEEPNSESKEIKVSLKSAHDFADFTSTIKRLEELQSNRAVPVLARSLFMQMFCEFDAFMGALLKTIYQRNAELLKGISREISMTDLMEYDDLGAVKRAMLDKEIETFRRDSYVEQFAQLEKKFGLTLRKFPEWGSFVELSQRRNIFTHNDGMVSDQYLAVCEREGFKFNERPALGDTLGVDFIYFGNALRIMSKVGFMLCHTLWCKVFPKEHPAIHRSLNNNLYSCLEEKRWMVAAELGDFALTEPMRKHVSEIDHRIRVINVAIALKFSEQEESARKLLGTLDWSASYRDFKLALCVLEDQFDDAVSLMLSIGKSGEILQQHSYHTWPLFHKFRERPEFYATYEKIYGVPYLAKVPSDGSLTDVTLAPSKEPATRQKRSKKQTLKTTPGTPQPGAPRDASQ